MTDELLPLPRVALVVAAAENGVIGRDGSLPWHLPDDLKYFRSVTLGKPVLMGRRTHESIGRPLPGRRNLVLSRRNAGAAGVVMSAPAPEVEFVPSLAAARELCRGAEELCVIGGAEVYAMALPLATRVYLTRVHAVVPGDAFFSLRALGQWTVAERHTHPADARHVYPMSFERLERP